MSEPAADIHALLRTLVEQQTALLNAHAESVRLQRLLVEHLVAGSVSAAVAAPPGSVAGQAVTCETTHPAKATATVGVSQPVSPVGAEESIVSAAEPEPLAESISPERSGESLPATLATERPSLRVVGGTATRGEHYYQQAATSTSSAKHVSPEQLDTLRRIQATGEVAHLILIFGPHAGETLGQIAQTDPDYLRRLAATAQRPAVRVAAAQVAGALGAPAAPTRQSRTGWRHSGSSARP